MKYFRVLLVGALFFTALFFTTVNAASNLSVQSHSFSQAILKPSINLTCTVNVKNNGTDGESYIIAMALYNPNKGLEGMKTESYTTAAGATMPVTVTMAMPSYINGYTVKVFLWRGFSDLQPQGSSLLVGSIDDITSTSYTPWWRQLNMACAEEVSVPRKGGEAAQMVWAFAASPTNPQNLLLGTDTAGVWRSNDGGATWVISSEGLNIGGTVDVAYDPDDGNIAYVAGSPNNDLNPHSNNAGIYKSTDGGVSWVLVKHTHFDRIFTNKIIQFGAINGNGIRTVYVGTHKDGIWKSEDRGVTWISLGRTSDNITDLYVNGTTMMAAVSVESGVVVSTDNGATWQSRNTGLTALPQIKSLAVNPKDSNMWFAILQISNQAGAIYKSTNAGVSWSAITAPTTSTSTGFKYAKLIFGAPPVVGDPILYLSLNSSINSLRKSINLGGNWSIPSVKSTTSYFKSNTGWFAEPIAVHPTDPNIVWAPFDTQVYKSTDGGTNFYPSGSGFSGFRASDFLFDKYNSGNVYMALFDRGIAKSIDVGFSTNYPAFSSTANSYISYGGGKTVHSIVRDPANPQHLIMNNGNWGSSVVLKQSFDGGTTFSAITGTENLTSNFISYHPQNNNIIYAGKNYSLDNGATWPSPKLPKRVAAVSPFNGDVVWAVDGDYIYKSTNRGQTWGAALNSTPIYGIQRLLADSSVQDRLWIGTYQSGIYVLDGNTLTRRGTAEGLVRNINNVLGIFDIAQDPKNGNNMVAGGVDNVGYGPTAGLFESADGGNTWSVVPGMPGMRDIWRVKFHPTLSQVYVATSSGTFVYDYSLNKNSKMNVPRYSSTTFTASKDTNIQVGSTIDFDNIAAPDYYGYNLRVRNAGGTGDWRAYIEFDLSSFTGNITSAIMQLNCNNIQTQGSPQTVQVYELQTKPYLWPNDPVNDSSMNSLNAPAIGNAISGATVSVTGSGTYAINVTSFIADQYNSGNKKLTLALTIPTNTNQYVVFASKESGANAPKLVVTYQ